MAQTQIQMGARVYLPGLGRFLQPDPQDGGLENNYVYPPDPINYFDLTGTWGISFNDILKAATIVTNPAACNQPSANLNAHKNSNRTATTANGVTTSNCYNQADQLISSTDAQIGTPTYDDHGNTVTLAGAGIPITFTYNSSDQNTAISQGTNKVEYLKSASGMVLRKKEYENNTLVRSYRFVADGKVMQSCSLANDNDCQTTDKYISLAGNVLLTVTPNAQDVNNQFTYSLLNNHGDTAMTARADGTPTSSIFLYEPFGQTSNSQTFQTSSNPQNATNATMGWAASPARKAETLFSLNIVQMGARVYIPTQGRFLQTDPVEGGTPNSYVYVFDPVNGDDYSGRIAWVIPALAYLFMAAVAYSYATNPSIQKASGELLASARNSLKNLVNQGFRSVPTTSPKSPKKGCQPRQSPGDGKKAMDVSTAENKYEQKALESTEYELKQGNGPVGKEIIEPRIIEDSRWLATGEGKYGANFTAPDGSKFQVHYMYNEDTCTYGDIKISSRSKK